MIKTIGIMFSLSLIASQGFAQGLQRSVRDIPINESNFSCDIYYENHSARISYENRELLSELGQREKHHAAQFETNDLNSFRTTCALQQEILRDAAVSGGSVRTEVTSYWITVKSIVGCEGGKLGWLQPSDY